MRVCVAGQNALATAAVEGISRLGGVEIVRQISDVGVVPAGTDVLVEMVGGVEPAFRPAMAALGTGVSCIVTSPMLVAAHGRVLASAAQGMHCFLGLSGAGMGVGIEKIAAGADVRKVTALWGDGGSSLLARMEFRNEGFDRVRADFERRGEDLSDAGGKVTQARAAAMLGACGAWPRLSSQVRVAVDAVEMADVRKMRELGLGLVYGAVLEAGHVYAGPLAVALDGILLRERGRDAVLLETSGGEILWSRDADEGRVVRGVLGDMTDVLRMRQGAGVEMESLMGSEVSADEGQCYVRLPLGRRDAVLANVERVLEERVDGDGMWQAVVDGVHIGRLRLLASDGLALPVAGEWAAAASAGLRLVG